VLDYEFVNLLINLITQIICLQVLHKTNVVFKLFCTRPGVGNLFMLEGRINLAVIKYGRIQETSIRYT
jgi:hypothetical protein